MGKAAMCIKMLQVLNTGRIYKVSELAELLETNPRNIIEYKKELDEIASTAGSGFYIDTIPGRYGGYKLNGNITLPAFQFTKKEKDVMSEALNYLLEKNDFLHKDTLEEAFAKIFSNIDSKDKKEKLLSVDKYQLQMKPEEIEERHAFLENCIKAKESIEMAYLSLKSGEKIHVVDPYTLFLYNNSWFFLGWDHEAGEVYYYKLNRIKSMKLINKKFQVYKYFKAENYFNESGLKNNGEYHHVSLIATGTRAMLLKERVYGKNQVITELEDGSIKVELDMQNDNTIVSFALSCGDEVTILEPQWLIDQVKTKIDSIRSKYE